MASAGVAIPSRSRRSPLRALAGCVAATVVLAVVGTLGTAGSAHARRAVDVAVVSDSPLRLVAVDALIREQTTILLEEDFIVRFPPSAQITLDGDASEVSRALDRVLSDGSIEVVIGLGSQVAVDLARRGPLPKPALAALAFDPEVLGLPRDGDVSGVKNFTYVTTPVAFEESLDFVRRFGPTDRVALVIGSPALESNETVLAALREYEDVTGSKLEIVPHRSSLAEAAAAVPVGSDAVVTGPLLRHTEEEVRGFADALIARGIPAFALLGAREVELGFIASLSPTSEFMRIARRIALGAQKALLGEDPGTFRIELAARAEKTINAASAVALGKVPPFNEIVGATLINRDALRTGDELTLADALLMAVDVNLDLLAEGNVVASGREDVMLAIARLLPQATLSYSATAVDDDRASVAQGQPAERTQEGRAQLSQVLFDEKLLAGVTVNKYLLASSEAAREQVKLEVLEGTGIAYLNVLRTAASQRIQEENERVTRENLRLAETRMKVGTAAAGEVYRWRSQLARDERSTLFAFRDQQQSRLGLARILNRPLEEDFRLEGDPMSTVAHVFGDKRVQEALATPVGFDIVRDWFVDSALRHSPDLNELDARVAAQERTLKSNRREFYAPSVEIVGDYTRLADESGEGAGVRAGTGEDDDRWSVGLRASLPLFSGGRRVFQTRQATENLSELKTRRDATRQRVEENVRVAAYDAWASFLAIGLSRTAADAANRNLELVTKSYSRGAVSVIDLLDAQRTATTARDEAANAVFDHLVTLMSLQRAGGRFWLFLDDAERKADLDELQQRIRSRTGLRGQD